MNFSLSDLKVKLSGFLDNLSSSAPGNTNGTNQTTTPSFWQRYALNFGSSQSKTNSTNNQAMRQVAQKVDTWRSDGDEKKKVKAQTSTPLRSAQINQDDSLPSPKAVIIELKEGKKQAGYDDLARRVTLAALERNGIHPSNIEMEELMALPASKNLDMNGWIDKQWQFHDLPGLMPEAGKHRDANGNEVFGYKQTFSPKFQQSLIDDYHKIKGELALTPDKKAVIDMSMNERLSETVKIAYDKGYISQEIKDKLGKLKPEELAAAFALGGAIGIAATNAELGAVLGPVGVELGFVYTGQQLTKFSSIADGAAKATNREQLDQPAREFGQWMGSLSKDGVLALAGMAGGAIAPRAMPNIEAALDSVYGSVKNTAAGQSNLKLPVLGLPEPVPVTPGAPGNKLPVPVQGAPNTVGKTITVKPNDTVLTGLPGTVAKPDTLEMRSMRGADIGGSRAPLEGRRIPNRGNGAPEWNDASRPAVNDAKATGALKGHAGKHGGDRVLPPEAQAYYDQAVKNMNFGAKFEYTHGGQIKTGYITKISDKEYLFTGCARNSKRIFTHYIMSKNDLRNIGIALKQE